MYASRTNLAGQIQSRVNFAINLHCLLFLTQNYPQMQLHIYDLLLYSCLSDLRVIYRPLHVSRGRPKTGFANRPKTFRVISYRNDEPESWGGNLSSLLPFFSWRASFTVPREIKANERTDRRKCARAWIRINGLYNHPYNSTVSPREHN